MKKEKVCEFCGRFFEFRKKWEKNWDEIKFCSDRCRQENKGLGKKVSADHQAQILQILKSRGSDKTMCPSEVLVGDQKKDKDKMEAVRQAARLLVQQGLIQITQGGKVVDPDSFRGAIRLRIKK